MWRDIPFPGDRLNNVKLYSLSNSTFPMAQRSLRDCIRLQNLTSKQKLAFCGLTVVVPWLLSKFLASSVDDDVATNSGGGHPATLITRLLAWVKLAIWYYRIFDLANFLLFMANGSYRGIPERLLGLQTVHISPIAQRQTSFDTMNMQLYWYSVTDFLLRFLPMVDTYAVFMLAQRCFNNTKEFLSFAKTPTPPSINTSENRCTFCGAKPITVAFTSRCGHPFCYYCGVKATDSKAASCSQCGETIYEMHRFY